MSFTYELTRSHHRIRRPPPSQYHPPDISMADKKGAAGLMEKKERYRMEMIPSFQRGNLERIPFVPLPIREPDTFAEPPLDFFYDEAKYALF